MKKKLFSVLLCVLVAAFLSACGSGGGKSVDESFISSEAKGLQARLDLSDQQDKESLNDGDSFVACVDAELSSVSEYKENF